MKTIIKFIGKVFVIVFYILPISISIVPITFIIKSFIDLFEIETLAIKRTKEKEILKNKYLQEIKDISVQLQGTLTSAERDNYLDVKYLTPFMYTQIFEIQRLVDKLIYS